MDDVLVLRREEEKDLLRDLTGRLSSYVGAVKRTEDERDKLAEELTSRTARYKLETNMLKEQLGNKQTELDAALSEMARLSILDTSHTAKIKGLTAEIARLEKAARDLVAAREDLRIEQEGHAKTRVELERAKKESEAGRQQARDAVLSERKAKSRLGSTRAQLEALEKAYKDLERSKAEALEGLIRKKDEEIHAASQGWVSATNDKLAGVERRLHVEHQEELKEMEVRMKDMKEELVKRTGTLEVLTKRYDAVVKELDVKIKELSTKYRDNMTQAQERISYLETLKEQYHGAMEEAQRKYHRLANSKIAYDTELLQMKDMLDGEDVRRERKRRRSMDAEEGTTLRKVKRVMVPGGLVIVDVHPEKRYLVIENQGAKDIDLTGWTITCRLSEPEREALYVFPRHYTIKELGTITIRVVDEVEAKGKERRMAETAEEEAGELLWHLPGAWDGEGCMAVIRGADGKEVCSITVGPGEKASDLPDRALEAAVFVTPDRPTSPPTGRKDDGCIMC